MADQLIDEQIQRFCGGLHGMNSVYEEYARSVNTSYTTLYILTLITQMEECTQKAICEETFLPKQTVNNVVTAFYRQGLVELRELPADRRTKTIHLTKAGREYADQIIPPIHRAEREAMAGLTEAQRAALIEGTRIYSGIFRRAMLGTE